MDILVSMMRSRDDNLILLCSNLLISILNRCSHEAISIMDIHNKGKTALLVIKSVINLLVLDPPFRPATVKTLYQLVTKMISLSGVLAQDLPEEDLSKLKRGFFRVICRRP